MNDFSWCSSHRGAIIVITEMVTNCTIPGQMPNGLIKGDILPESSKIQFSKWRHAYFSLHRYVAIKIYFAHSEIRVTCSRHDGGCRRPCSPVFHPPKLVFSDKKHTHTKPRTQWVNSLSRRLRFFALNWAPNAPLIWRFSLFYIFVFCIVPRRALKTTTRIQIQA